MSTSPSTPVRAEAPPAEAPRDVRLPFAALVLAMLPAVLDQTILATALPTVAADLGSLADVSWVVTAYVLASTASTPLWGKLADRHGPRPLLLGGLALFVATSALCAAAQDLVQLTVLRAVQGVGAGGLMTLAMAAVAQLVPPRERGRYQGHVAAVFAGASVAGPLIGGLLVDHASWRWVFLVNLPVGVAALAGLAATLPAGRPDRPVLPLDVAGMALLVAATCGGLLLCVDGVDPFLLAGTLLAAAALAVRERRALDPIVPVTMLRTAAVATASAGLFLTTAGLFAVVVFVPVYLQAATGASPTGAGLLLLPMMAGITASTTLSGRAISRTGRYKRFPVAGLALMTAGLLVLAAVTSAESAVLCGAGLVVFGLGFGMVTQVLVVSVQNGVERQAIGIATATTGFFRALGGSVGAAVLGAVFTGALGAGTPSPDAVADAVRTVLLCAAPVTAAALAIVARMPEVPLKRA
jgi:EmrB/QacA subfamily drug resistance transporter